MLVDVGLAWFVVVACCCLTVEDQRFRKIENCGFLISDSCCLFVVVVVVVLFPLALAFPRLICSVEPAFLDSGVSSERAGQN